MSRINPCGKAIVFVLLTNSACAVVFTWPEGVSNSGPYTLLSGVYSSTVIAPDGNTPTEADLATHRYHHHTRIWQDAGVIWIAFSSAGVGEGDDGMQSAICISTNGGTNWTAPIVVVPSQSTWTTNHYTAGARFSFPRNFQKYNGTNYLVCAIETATGDGSHEESQALVACALTDTGVGTLYRISTNSYSATNGVDEVTYDAGYRSALMEYSKLYGCWGGSDDGTQREWLGYWWVELHTRTYSEPNTVFSDSTGTNMTRLWRHYSSEPMTYFVYQSDSTNSGDDWSLPEVTEIPNSPSETTIVRLTDGRFCIVGNAVGATESVRDPLYFAITAPNDFGITNVWAIRQNVTNGPTYSGFSKYGGAQYPGAVQATDSLYVSYSIAKESVGFSRFRIPDYQNPRISNSKRSQIGTITRP